MALLALGQRHLELEGGLEVSAGARSNWSPARENPALLQDEARVLLDDVRAMLR